MCNLYLLEQGGSLLIANVVGVLLGSCLRINRSSISKSFDSSFLSRVQLRYNYAMRSLFMSLEG